MSDTRVHPCESFIMKMTNEQLELFKLEVELNNSKLHSDALKDQFNRLGIKL
jgi:hypothetical protein